MVENIVTAIVDFLKNDIPPHTNKINVTIVIPKYIR